MGLAVIDLYISNHLCTPGTNLRINYPFNDILKFQHLYMKIGMHFEVNIYLHKNVKLENVQIFINLKFL